MQLNMKYDKDLVIPTIKPQCFLANGKKNPLVPVTNEGWSVLFFLFLKPLFWRQNTIPPGEIGIGKRNIT